MTAVARSRSTPYQLGLMLRTAISMPCASMCISRSASGWPSRSRVAWLPCCPRSSPAFATAQCAWMSTVRILRPLITTFACFVSVRDCGACAEASPSPHPTNINPVAVAASLRNSRRLRTLFRAAQLSHPDVSIANRVPVILESKWTVSVRRRVRVNLSMCGRPPERARVVHDDAVVNHGHDRRRVELGRGESGRREHDVVRLPFSGLSRRIDEGWKLTVHGGRLTVRVGWILEAVQHLNLEDAR